MPTAVILLEEEPVQSIVLKWLGWVVVVVVFVMALIYFSNYFARGSECFIPESTGIIIQDIKNAKWRQRFEQVDNRSFASTVV